MLRRSTVVRRAIGLGAAVGAVPGLFLGVGIAKLAGYGPGLGVFAFGLVAGALPGLAAGAALAASRKGARTGRWPVRAALAAGAVFFLVNELAVGLTRSPALAAVALLGTPVAMAVAAAAAAAAARRAGALAWVGPEEYPRHHRLDRARARRDARR
ncbi:hypothetical protein [Kitasatospora sp. NPDC004531]